MLQFGGLEKGRGFKVDSMTSFFFALFGARVLGYSLGALAHCMLGQFARQYKTHGRLYLTTRQGGTTVLLGQFGGLGGDPLEHVIDKRVHDAHRLARDARVRMHLLQHLVDVGSKGLVALFVALRRFLGRHTRSFLGSSSGRFWRCGHGAAFFD